MWEQHFRSIQNRIRAYCRPQRVTPSPRSPNVASTKPLSGELTTAGCGQYSTLTPRASRLAQRAASTAAAIAAYPASLAWMSL